MSKSSSMTPSSNKNTMNKKNRSKTKGQVDNTAGTAAVLVTAANDGSNDMNTNNNIDDSEEVGKANNSTTKSQDKTHVVDPSTLAAATAIVKAAGSTGGTSEPNNKTNQGSENLHSKERHVCDVDPETLKAAAVIVAAASQDIKGDMEQTSGDQKGNSERVPENQTKKNNERGHGEEFDYTKIDALSPVALAEASKTIAASIKQMNDKGPQMKAVGTNFANGKQSFSDKEPQRSFSPNTVATARAIVATSKQSNGNQIANGASSRSSNAASSQSTSNRNTCVSPNTLTSAMTIISASENHPNEFDILTSDRAKKTESKEMTKQTKKGSKKINVVSGRINMNGAKGRKASTSTTPRHNQNMKKIVDVDVNDDEYFTDSSIHSSEFDSLSDEDSEEERLAEVKERKKSVAQAMKKKDLKDLVYQLQEFKKNKDPHDEALVGEATKMISQLRAKEDLKMACNIREVPALERAIRKAKKVNDGKAIDIQIILASQLLKRLNRIERLSRTVLQINQNALVEMKKYITPPTGVHEALHATFLILGEQPSSLTTWKSCQSLLFKTGKENIMRRISGFNPKLTSKDVAATAKKIIAPYSVVQIRDASLGASAFYVWAKGMIGEIETTGRSGSRAEHARSTRQLAPRSAVLPDDAIDRADTIVLMM
ncbi:uncharacterized protein LOC117326479 [Pecten maximus]|uniref:uncharacterized protein LOC117326479 n=1 Tax=Pecten maximus TaxID=6579 RepID=UPI001458A3B7|nr:uncharacterized protein LOC117326479 [Pecten maximus]